MKLSEIKGERALDVLADLIEPLTEIASDANIANAVKNKVSNAELIKTIIKNHKKSIIEIMATIDGVPAEKYEFNILTLPLKILSLINDETVQTLFGLQGRQGGATSSGSASESTVEN